MPTTDDFETLEANVTSLEKALGDTSEIAAAFDGQLRGVQATLGETARDLGKLETGFSSGLRRAFDGLVFDGLKLSDALGIVAKAMADTAYSAAIKPVMSHFGGLLAHGVNAAVEGLMPYADGAAFSSGRMTPFAKGGVLSGPTTFPIRGGVGLMGEAGPEAIMPLTRGPDGALGVRAQGSGPVTVTMNITTPDVQGFQRSRSQIATQMARAIGQSNRNR